MLTMSKALSAGQANDYYQQQFISAKENYYSESGEITGRWCGTLAEEWDLKGEVTNEQYERSLRVKIRTQASHLFAPFQHAKPLTRTERNTSPARIEPVGTRPSAPPNPFP